MSCAIHVELGVDCSLVFLHTVQLLLYLHCFSAGHCLLRYFSHAFSICAVNLQNFECFLTSHPNFLRKQKPTLIQMVLAG